MTQFIWVVGSPRSGTTFVTDYLGQYADKTYNEPWTTHPIETPTAWTFPDVNKIVFKYCENWKNLHTLMKGHYLLVHVWRDPDNVVYSMAYPKEGSYPPRDLYCQHTGRDKLWHCMERWYTNVLNCLSIYNITPRYVEVRYEDVKTGLGRLTNLSKEIQFNNRNINPNLEWDIHPQAQELRNIIKGYNAVYCLARWVNNHLPKLLKRPIL